MVGVLVVGPIMVGLAGHEYGAHGTTFVRIIALSVPFTMVRVLYQVFTWLEQRVWLLLVISALSATGLIGLSIVLLPPLGITGVAWAYLISQAFAAALMAPPVWRRLRAIRRAKGPLRLEVPAPLSQSDVADAPFPEPVGRAPSARDRRHALGSPAETLDRSAAARGATAGTVTAVGGNRWVGAQRSVSQRWRDIPVADQTAPAVGGDGRRAQSLNAVGETRVPAGLATVAEAETELRRDQAPEPDGRRPDREALRRRLDAVAWAGICVAVLSPLLVLAVSNPHVRLIGILLFAGLGCGTGVMCRLDAGEGLAQWALTVVLSLAAYALAQTLMIWAHVWHANLVLLLALPSGISCALRLRASRRAAALTRPPEADDGD
jgi:hypothetical protein